MVSADAGVWLAFFRNESSAADLRPLLDEHRVAMHPLVLLDLRLRLRVPQRQQILTDLEHLLATEIEAPEFVSAFVEERGLERFQIGVVEAHLLASAVRHGDELWAAHRDLRAAAVQLGVAFRPDSR